MSDNAWPYTARILDRNSLSRDLTAWELAQIMVLQVQYSDQALAAMPDEVRAIVVRNSRPV